MARNAWKGCLAAALAAAAPLAAAEDLAATLGKQRATGSRVEWEIREAGHPALGAIRFAYVKRPVETRVGSSVVYSRAYFSCQRERRTFALELANATAPADPGGLKPAADPRLLCNRPLPGGSVAREEILASWDINEKIGDVMTRGLRAFPLRECASISVQQEVALPESWGQKTARIEFELHPYAREIDSIFTTCGERSAYGPGPAGPAVAAAAQQQPSPRPPSPQPSPKGEGASGWREARTLPTGKTNVRAGPTLQSKIAAELHPGSVVMVQRAQNEWWRARPSRGSAWEGFIRQDRLVFR